MHGASNLIVAPALFLIDKKGRKLPPLKTKLFFPSLFGLLLLQIGVLAFDYALSFGTATLVTVTANTYVVISLILAIIFLKEKLTRQQLAGVLSVITGIILIGIT